MRGHAGSALRTAGASGASLHGHPARRSCPLFGSAEVRAQREAFIPLGQALASDAHSPYGPPMNDAARSVRSSLSLTLFLAVVALLGLFAVPGCAKYDDLVEKDQIA